MSNHTAGPWSVQHGEYTIRLPAQPVTSAIAVSIIDGPEGLFNALLIASAPDLLTERDALRLQVRELAEALNYCHNCLQADFADFGTIEGRRAVVAMNKARSALSPA